MTEREAKERLKGIYDFWTYVVLFLWIALGILSFVWGGREFMIYGLTSMFIIISDIYIDKSSELHKELEESNDSLSGD